MITVEITIADVQLGGVYSVVRKLRDGGIPVRVGPDQEVRLCPVWNAEGTRLIGRGAIVCTEEWDRVVYDYEPPIDKGSNVIDVEARVVEDHLQLEDKS